MQFDIVLTKHQNNGYTARPVLWPEVVATGDSEDDALTKVRAKIVELQLHEDSKVVQIEVAGSEKQNGDGPKAQPPKRIVNLEAKSRWMAQEKKAFQGMLGSLREKHLGEYVAIFQGKLIDHDEDELVLLRRINKSHPDNVVLMTQVLARPRPIPTIRSPGIVRED